MNRMRIICFCCFGCEKDARCCDNQPTKRGSGHTGLAARFRECLATDDSDPTALMRQVRVPRKTNIGPRQ